SLSACQGERRSPGYRRGDVPGDRSWRAGEISRTTSRGVGKAELSPPTAAEGQDTERRREDSPTFDTLHPRPSGPGCVEVDPGTDLRGRFPTGVVWLPAEEVSHAALGSDLEATHLRDRLRSASLL